MVQSLHQRDSTAMRDQLSDEQWARIDQAIYGGRKIEAIKLAREFCNIGLKEAKEFVEGYESDLRKQSPEKFSARPSGCTVRATAALLSIVAAVAVLGWVVF